MTSTPTRKIVRCACGCSRSAHRQALHLRHERGACKQCDCREYAPVAHDGSCYRCNGNGVLLDHADGWPCCGVLWPNACSCGEYRDGEVYWKIPCDACAPASLTDRVLDEGDKRMTRDDVFFEFGMEQALVDQDYEAVANRMADEIIQLRDTAAALREGGRDEVRIALRNAIENVTGRRLDLHTTGVLIDTTVVAAKSSGVAIV